MSVLRTIDLGSFNIKASTGEIFENRFVNDNVSDTFGAEVLELEGNRYFFGKGSFNRTFSKAHKDIEIPLLYALGKTIPSDYENVNLILHLPLSQIDMKGQIIERLQGKTFEFEINGDKKVITLNKVAVVKEGWASFYSLPKRNSGLIAIWDIGGRTTDIFTFVDGRQEKEISIPIGTMNLFSDIAAALNAKGENRKIEDIHKLITHGVKDLNDFTGIVEKFVGSITNEFKIEIEDMGDYQIKLTGGGAKYICDIVAEIYSKVETMSNAITSNVTGSYNIGKAKGLGE